MRDAFSDFYPADDGFHDRLWAARPFVALDASVLLDLHVLPVGAVAETLALLRRLAPDRLFVPYQAGLEYHRNLDAVFRRQLDQCADAVRSLRAFHDGLGTTSANPRSRPHLPAEEVARVRDGVCRLMAHVKGESAELQRRRAKDPLADEVADVLKGAVGPRPTEKEETAWEAEAARRFARRIPPGYLDAVKPDGGSGDYVLWRQVMAHAKAQRAGAVLVTQDVSEDWFVPRDGSPRVPRPELREEFRRATGQEFFACELASFLEEAPSRLATAVGAGTIEAAKGLGRQEPSLFSVFMRTLGESVLAMRLSDHFEAGTAIRRREGGYWVVLPSQDGNGRKTVMPFASLDRAKEALGADPTVLAISEHEALMSTISVTTSAPEVIVSKLGER